MTRAAFIAYTLVLAYLMLTPGVGAGFNLWDKAVHTAVYAAYAVLGVLLCREQRSALWMLAAVFAYSTALELGQAFVPSRTPSSLDLVANTLGVMIGGSLAVKLRFSDSATGDS